MAPRSKREPIPSDPSASESTSTSTSEKIKQEPETEEQLVLQPQPDDGNSLEPEFRSDATEVEFSQLELEPDTAIQAELKMEAFESSTNTPPAPEAEPKLESEVIEPLTLEITQLKFWQPPEAEKIGTKNDETQKPELEKAMIVNLNNRALPGILRKGEPFQIEVGFHITGTGAVELTREPFQLYHAQCFIQNRSIGERVQLERESAGTLREGKLPYTSRFLETTLPKAGSYRLQVVMRLDRGQANPAFFELPFMEVV